MLLLRVRSRAARTPLPRRAVPHHARKYHRRQQERSHHRRQRPARQLLERAPALRRCHVGGLHRVGRRPLPVPVGHLGPRLPLPHFLAVQQRRDGLTPGRPVPRAPVQLRILLKVGDVLADVRLQVAHHLHHPHAGDILLAARAKVDGAQLPVQLPQRVLAQRLPLQQRPAQVVRQPAARVLEDLLRAARRGQQVPGSLIHDHRHQRL
mmetsp:Transcript_26316/g.66142  ORF Transcript_26316/g.66142 Transcript_26316/m.66142 type:complete len:208 (+) Transcript_26316:49-672(+)